MTFSGVRTLRAITSHSAWFRSPREMNFTIGSRSPSWKISSAPSALLPATMPPTSQWCATVVAHATSRHFAVRLARVKIGVVM